MDLDSRTVYCGNLSPNVTEEILYELFLQAGPLKGVTIPKDNKRLKQYIFAFIEFQHECSVDYSLNLLQGTKLYGQELCLKARNKNKPNSVSQHHDRPNMQCHTSLPNMSGMFPSGSMSVQPPLNVFRAPGYFYPPMPPMPPMLVNVPMFNPVNLFVPHANVPFLPRGMRGDLPIPPGESSSSYYKEQERQRDSHFKRFHEDDRASGCSSFHPDDKRSRFSDSLSRPYGEDASRYHREDDDRRRSMDSSRYSHSRNDDESRFRRERDNRSYQGNNAYDNLPRAEMDRRRGSPDDRRSRSYRTYY